MGKQRMKVKQTMKQTQTIKQKTELSIEVLDKTVLSGGIGTRFFQFDILFFHIFLNLLIIIDSSIHLNKYKCTILSYSSLIIFFPSTPFDVLGSRDIITKRKNA